MAATAGSEKLWAYVGTYTDGDSQGIYLLELDLGDGSLTSRGLAGEAVNPSFLAIHPSRRFLYSVDEISDFKGKKSGAATAFSIDAQTGKLTRLNQATSGGGGPCHLSVDATGKALLLANYGGGSVEAVPIGADGRLGDPASFIQHEGHSVNPRRQEGPHAHSINLDAANRFAIAADLGLDKLFVYRLDPQTGKLTPNTPPSVSVAPGSGPRHFAFHPNGRFAYVINELKSTVTVFDYNAERGILTPIQTLSSLPADFDGTSYPAEIQVHPSGKFVYGSNRGHDSLVIYSVNQDTGKLTLVGFELTRGKNPRNFAIDPTGHWLLAANQDTSDIYSFKIDGDTGKLTYTGHMVKIPKPVCIKMMPAGG